MPSTLYIVFSEGLVSTLHAPWCAIFVCNMDCQAELLEALFDWQEFWIPFNFMLHGVQHLLQPLPSHHFVSHDVHTPAKEAFERCPLLRQGQQGRSQKGMCKLDGHAKVAATAIFEALPSLTRSPLTTVGVLSVVATSGITKSTGMITHGTSIRRTCVNSGSGWAPYRWI